MSDDRPPDPWDKPLFPEQRCASCKHWHGGRMQIPEKTRLLEGGWCTRFGALRRPDGLGDQLDDPLRLIGPHWDEAQVITRHDFGCTEWERASADETRDPIWERVKASRASTTLRRVK